ncbi:MAG: 2-amino-4-hydroxy-6-hydroxymethyldihydropteridine diphosphokinase [Dehalococcoidia bacterium]
MVNTSIGHKVKVYLGIGSNLGIKEANLAQALKLLPPQVTVAEVSSIYQSEPVGYKDQPRFLNIVCSAYTDLTPEGLLDYVKHIEVQLGRTLSFRDAPRALDIDILFYGDQVLDTDRLIVPHPRMPERAFVLLPLAELNPVMLHPGRGETIGQLLSALSGQERVKKRKWSSLYARDLLHKPSGHLMEADNDQPQGQQGDGPH